VSKNNGLNKIKEHTLLNKNVVLQDSKKIIATGKVIELWYHEEDTGVDIVIDNNGNLENHIISLWYLNILEKEHK
jgi:hypothetical protein